MMNQHAHAVLLIVFNRPDTTKQVFDAIRSTKVAKLYIAADGPRPDTKKDIALCKQVREIVSNIDWPCEVETLFRDENRGCRFGPSEAIDWFFTHEPAGIILEDDCLPHPDFFKYCSWALEHFKDNRKVWHINGNNFAASPDLYRSTLDFTSLAQVWGWATWADRWQSHRVNPFHIRAEAWKYDSHWQLSSLAKKVKKFHIERLCLGLDAWDYQWQVTILNQQGLCLSPSANLISNIGDDSDASHTKRDRRTHLPIQSIGKHFLFPEIKVNQKLTLWYEKKMGLRRRSFSLIYSLIEIFRGLVTSVRGMTFNSKVLPIVVSSSGRSGSTLLCEAIAKDYINHHLGLKPRSFIGGWLSIFARCFVDRLEQVKSTKSPVQKTHALFETEYLDDARYIFVYGLPLDSALSVRQVTQKRGGRWFEKHLFHLQSDSQPDVRNVLLEDILNYEKQLRTWLSTKHPNVMPIYYEDLWDKQNEISEFVGFPVSLPERVPRADKTMVSEYNSVLFDRLSDLMEEYRKACR